MGTLRNGDVIEEGTLTPLQISPGEEMMVHVPFTLKHPNVKKEYYITFRFYLQSATFWAPADYLMAFAQLPISVDSLLQTDQIEPIPTRERTIEYYISTSNKTIKFVFNESNIAINCSRV